MIPIDQISALSPYFCFLITYGAIVIIVPRVVPYATESAEEPDKVLEKPKSTIFKTPL